MARDKTPDEIKLVNDNFANENHERLAGIMLDEWGASTKCTELGDEYDSHRATFQKVYERYFGIPESEFNDGIVDSRTIQQIRSVHETDEEKGAISIYYNLRKHGNLNPDDYRGVERMDEPEPDESDQMYTQQEVMKIMEIAEERYEKGFEKGFEAGLEAAD